MASQVFIEFWSVTTRPRSVNGLGWSEPQVSRVVHRLLDALPLADEPPDVFMSWLAIVSRYSVAGKHVHDARLAALMLTSSIPNILTCNTSDFPEQWGVIAISPHNLVGT